MSVDLGTGTRSVPDGSGRVTVIEAPGLSECPVQADATFGDALVALRGVTVYGTQIGAAPFCDPATKLVCLRIGDLERKRVRGVRKPMLNLVRDADRPRGLGPPGT